jgi:hypothetical protein
LARGALPLKIRPDCSVTAAPPGATPGVASAPAEARVETVESKRPGTATLKRAARHNQVSVRFEPGTRDVFDRKESQHE